MSNFSPLRHLRFVVYVEQPTKLQPTKLQPTSFSAPLRNYSLRSAAYVITAYVELISSTSIFFT